MFLRVEDHQLSVPEGNVFLINETGRTLCQFGRKKEAGMTCFDVLVFEVQNGEVLHKER